jgi:transcriptional regulator with XRE-family HTH domain
MIGITRLAYGDLERGKYEISHERLVQIANALGVSLQEIEEVEEKISNFFENCAIQSVNGLNKGDLHYYANPRELKMELEKAHLENKSRDYQIEALLAKLEKAEIEAKYWREKYENRK